MNLRRSGSQPSSKGPAEFFTGNVRIDPLFRHPIPRARVAPVSRSSPVPALPGTPIHSAKP